MSLRFLTAGESHGPALTAIVEGMPAGVPLTAADIQRQLRRRMLGYGRGRRMQIETDEVEILSGVRHGQTLGSPIALLIRNRDWDRWRQAMAIEPPDAARTTGEARGEGDWRLRPVTCPRPGHADLPGMLKYGFDDARNVLERASARETAMRVAAGAVARALVEQFGIVVGSHVVQIGPVVAARRGQEPPSPEDLARADASPVRCLDPTAEQAMVAVIDEAKAKGETLGGVFEVVAWGVPPGLGSHVHWDRKLDARLAAAVMSIQAIKGVEIGLGFAAAGLFGSQVHDAIFVDEARGIHRATNRAGGIEGGMSNGQPIVVRAAMKPLATLYTPLPSVDMATRTPATAAIERSDVTAVPAAAVVAEAAVAFELARAMLEKFGGDSLSEMRRSYDAFVADLARRGFVNPAAWPRR
ncbi:MAG: chorismate synthase [Limnochordales bacterium]